MDSDCSWFTSTAINRKENYSTLYSETALLLGVVDLGIATDEETSLLAAWKKYRILSSRKNQTQCK
ncbi:tail fiber assembly protein [Escherichia albertii]|uniref:tail fiber assembly protein n=1 Tax=Escherichia albertii TaxID=208962 RepID=UPI000DE52561